MGGASLSIYGWNGLQKRLARGLGFSVVFARGLQGGTPYLGLGCATKAAVPPRGAAGEMLRGLRGGGEPIGGSLCFREATRAPTLVFFGGGTPLLDGGGAVVTSPGSPLSLWREDLVQEVMLWRVAKSTS